MKSLVYLALAFVCLSLLSMEEEPAQPLTTKELIALIHPLHAYTLTGIGIIIAQKEMRRSSDSNVYDLRRSANRIPPYDPVAKGAHDLFKKVQEVHELAERPTPSNKNFDFLKHNDYPDLIKFKDQDGKSMLHKAVEHRNLALIDFLIKFQPDLLYTRDANQKSPFEYIKENDEELKSRFASLMSINPLENSLEGSPKNQSLLDCNKTT